MLASVQIGNELRKLHASLLPLLIAEGSRLFRARQSKSHQLAQLVIGSLGERAFLLLRDVYNHFQSDLQTGYFASASLTRDLIETASTIVVLNRDNSGEALSSFLNSAIRNAKSRRDGLTRLHAAKDPDVAAAAKQETAIVDQVIDGLKQITGKASLPVTSGGFPNMAQRCKSLGEVWEFMYCSGYKELSESVHGGFIKVPHAPSLAFASPNEGAPLIYEHCRAMDYAVEFWGITILECCQTNPIEDAYSGFHDRLAGLLAQASSIVGRFSPLEQSHSIKI